MSYRFFFLHIIILCCISINNAVAWEVTPLKQKPYTAWLASITDAKAITLAFSFSHSGGAYDSANKQGLAHFLSASLLEGAGDTNASELKKILHDHSLELSFNSSKDSLNGLLRFLPKHQDIAIDILQKILTKPNFEADKIEQIRQQILATIEADKRKPQFIANQHLWQTIFKNHPYSNPKEGNANSVNAITIQDLQQKKQASFTQQNLQIALVGALNQQQANSMLEKLTQHMPITHELSHIVPVTNYYYDMWQQKKPNIIYIPQDVKQTNIIFALPAFTRNSDLFFSAYVMNDMLGGSGLESFLSQKIREEKGLTYGIGTGMHVLAKASLWVGSTSTAPSNLSTMLQELAQYIPSTAAYSPKKLQQTITRNIGAFALHLTSSRAIASILLNFIKQGRKPSYLQMRASYFKQVTDTSVQQAHHNLFQYQACPSSKEALFGNGFFCHMTMVIVGPKSAYDGLTKAQKTFIQLQE